jgi:hypothetical protein
MQMRSANVVASTGVNYAVDLMSRLNHYSIFYNNILKRYQVCLGVFGENGFVNKFSIDLSDSF